VFSRILVKLVDQSITPAILLISTRLISVVAVSRIFDIQFRISGGGFTFNSPEDYLLVNSYSTFVMIVVLTVGLLYILLKSYLFHESHITPSMTAKLFTLRLSSFIQSSFDLYSQGSIWLSYSYLISLVTGFMYMFKLMYPWVFFASITLTLISTVLLILDVESELQMRKSGEAAYDDTAEFLEDRRESHLI